MYERHTVISSWLMYLGVPKKVALEDACRIEHVISAESFEALKKHVYEKKELPESNVFPKLLIPSAFIILK